MENKYKKRNEQKIYYGRCALWLYQYIPLEEEEIKMYYLKKQ